MRVNYFNGQFVGKSHYNGSNNSASRTYLHFLYKSQYVEGFATISIPVFDNNNLVDVSQLVLKENYKVCYVSDKGYNTLVTIEKV